MPATTVGCCQRVLQWLKCFASKLQLAMCPITYLLLLLPCPMSKYISPCLAVNVRSKTHFPEFFRNQNSFSESVSLGSRIFCTQCWFYLNSHLWFPKHRWLWCCQCCKCWLLVCGMDRVALNASGLLSGLDRQCCHATTPAASRVDTGQNSGDCCTVPLYCCTTVPLLHCTTVPLPGEQRSTGRGSGTGGTLDAWQESGATSNGHAANDFWTQRHLLVHILLHILLHLLLHLLVHHRNLHNHLHQYLLNWCHQESAADGFWTQLIGTEWYLDI